MASTTTAALRTILGKVTSLFTLTTSNVGSGARLSAVNSLMAFLTGRRSAWREDEETEWRNVPAITASKLVEAFLGTVTNAMTDGGAVDTLDTGVFLVESFLRTSLGYVAPFCSCQWSTQAKKRKHTVAVAAFGHMAVVGKPRDLQALKIIFNTTRPAIVQIGTHGLRALEVADDKLHSKFTLEVDNFMAFANFLLLKMMSAKPSHRRRNEHTRPMR